MTNTRNAGVDVAKGLGMIAVVMSHMESVMSVEGASNLINAWSMPLFFVLAGVCYNDERHPRLGRFAYRRLRQLIVPAIFFTLVWLALAALSWSDLASRLAGTRHLPFALWFLPVLYVTEMTHWCLLRATRGNTMRLCAVAIASLCAALLLRPLGPGPFNMLAVPHALALYTLGHLLRKPILNLRPQTADTLPLLAALAALTAIAAVQCGLRLQMINNFFLGSHIPAALAGSAAVILASPLVAKLRWGGGCLLSLDKTRSQSSAHTRSYCTIFASGSCRPSVAAPSTLWPRRRCWRSPVCRCAGSSTTRCDG